jgi:aspartyl-tRNA(Asn)/glutamyl-tRNA(Gln) amidotransferase subunit B
MSSFRFIADALEYEIKRQQDVLEAGGHVKQETRLFDEGKKITLPMRSKEDAPDYRYFPDPDLVEVEIDRDFLDEIRERIPELPDQKVGRLMEAYGVSKNDALFLTRDRSVSDFFESCARVCGDKKKLSDWIARDLFNLLNDVSLPMESCPVRPEDFARLIDLLTRGDITERIGRVVLREMFETEKTPEIIIKEKDLNPVEDDHILGRILDEVMAENPEAVDSLKEGKKEAMNFLIGQVMKKTKGKAHGGKLNQMIRKKFFSSNSA